jgi:acetyl esterase/lipase
MIDNMLIARAASCDVRARLYANGHDLGDPLLSPVYGDLRGFPPTMLLSGTRDLLLSNTVRMHRKLRRAGVESMLEVFEGQPHGALVSRRERAREQGRIRGDRAFLRQASQEVRGARSRSAHGNCRLSDNCLKSGGKNGDRASQPGVIARVPAQPRPQALTLRQD